MDGTSDGRDGRQGTAPLTHAMRSGLGRSGTALGCALMLGLGLGLGTGVGDALDRAVAPAAQAQGVPTFDAGALTQLIAQLEHMAKDYAAQLEHLATLRAQLETEIGQLTNLEGQLAAMLEGTGLGDLLVSVEELNRLRGVFEDPLGDFEAIARGDYTGAFRGPQRGQAEGALRAALEPAGFDQPTMEALSASPEPADNRIAEAAGASGLLSVAAQQSHADAGASLGRLQDMVGGIDATPGLKEAVDLNTRITAELGIILTQIWMLEAAQGVSAGQLGVVDASTLAAERKFRRMTVEP